MAMQDAEDRFQKGLMLLESGKARDALPFLKAAIDMSRENGSAANRRSARYVSFYGVCLCMSRNSRRESLESCRTAARLNDIDPDIWWNLGRVAAIAGKRREAYRAWFRGLSLDNGHAGILTEMRRRGMRRQPVLSFLDRSHPLNIALGRMRARMIKKRRAA